MKRSDPDPTRLLRYLDGDLSPAEHAAFEASLEGDAVLAARVDTALAERDRLRIALRRAMASRTPAGLRERVLTSLHEETDATLAFMPAAADASTVARSTSHASAGHAGRAMTWAGPRRANWMAVAASLALVAGAVLLGVFGPRVPGRAPASGGPGNTPVTEVAKTMAVETASFGQHATCSTQDQPWRSLDEAERNLASLLRHPVSIPNLEKAGFNFCCGGPVCVPGACDRSGQLLYCRPSDSGEGCRWLSVFVAPVETRYLAFDPFGRTGPLECGINYSLSMPAGGEMHYWCDGHVTWFVNPADEVDFAEVRGLFPVG